MTPIESYDRVGTVPFGAPIGEVIAAFGEPEIHTKDRSGNDVLRYPDRSVTIADDGVVEFSFLPESDISIEGVFPFSESDAFWRLCSMDGNAQEFLGFIVLLNLGITLTGFHDRNESQKAITAFARGRWDRLAGKMRPFNKGN